MAKTAHGTLTPDVVTTIEIQRGFTGMEIVNRTYDGSPLWVRLDGVDPVPGGPDTYVVIGARSFDRLSRFEPVIVKLVAETAIAYSIEAAS